MIATPGYRLYAPRLRFHAALTGRLATESYKGLRSYGPFDASRVRLHPGSLLFVFPEREREGARRLWEAVIRGSGTYPGFSRMFRTEIPAKTVDHLAIKELERDVAKAAITYREGIADWATANGRRDPDLALVLVPHTEHFETLTPYYEAKAAFANLGVPTQMVTSELLSDERQFGWSVANIALASFAKLGGVPWTVEAPAAEHDLIIGVGRRELGSEGQRRRSFGYAVSFVSNGVYRQTWSFTPTADRETYELRLREAVLGALSEDLDAPPRRVVIHLAKSTGAREIQAVSDAIAQAGVSVPVAYLRLDDSSMWDLADISNQKFIGSPRRAQWPGSVTAARCCSQRVRPSWVRLTDRCWSRSIAARRWSPRTSMTLSPRSSVLRMPTGVGSTHAPSPQHSSTASSWLTL
jgi:hypothetical protein